MFRNKSQKELVTKKADVFGWTSAVLVLLPHRLTAGEVADERNTKGINGIAWHTADYASSLFLSILALSKVCRLESD